MFGFSGDERHRIERIRVVYEPEKCEIPLEKTYFLDTREKVSALKRYDIAPPRLYGMGFSHNNCGGGCVHAGQAQWVLLLEKMPERYHVWEDFEQEMRTLTGKNIAYTKKTVQGVSYPYTLRELREDIERKKGCYDKNDTGICQCFMSDLFEDRE